ncbi:hypothetical protein BDQ17DRAFT_1069772 [Cyathus striatus]|nr:hypothetical protein BDQ17DRAFT_1069772 [Cyathus striatus]
MSDSSSLKVKVEEDTVHESRKCRLCRSILSEGYQYKLCIECRERTRKYQAERARQKRASGTTTGISERQGPSDVKSEDIMDADKSVEEVRAVAVDAGNASWETIRDGDIPEDEAPGPPLSQEPESEAEEDITKDEDRQSVYEMDEDQARQLDSSMQVDELDSSEGIAPVIPLTSGSGALSTSVNIRTELIAPPPSSVSIGPTNSGSTSAETPPASASSAGKRSALPPVSHSAQALNGATTRPCTACKAPVSLGEKFKLCLGCRLNRRDYQRMRNQRLRGSQSATRSVSVSVSAAPTASLKHPSLANYQPSVSAPHARPSAPPLQSTDGPPTPTQSSLPKRPPSPSASNAKPLASTSKIQQGSPSSASESKNGKSPYTTQPLSLPPPQSIPSLHTEPSTSASNAPLSAISNHHPSTPQQPSTPSRKRGRKPRPSPPVPNSSSGKRCNICKAWLLQGYDYKLCALCREKGRRYQNERNERLRVQQGRERSTRGRKRRKLGDEVEGAEEVEEDENAKMEIEEEVVKMEDVEGNLSGAPGAGKDDGGEKSEDKGNGRASVVADAMDIDAAESSRSGGNITSRPGGTR